MVWITVMVLVVTGVAARSSYHDEDFTTTTPEVTTTMKDCSREVEGTCVKDGPDGDATDTQFRAPAPPPTFAPAPPPVPLGASVAFSVRKAVGSLFAPVRPLHFQDMLTNWGGGWDLRKGLFSAPQPGLYFFIFHAIGEESSDFTLSLMHGERFALMDGDGRYQVTAYGTQRTYEHGSNSAVLELTWGDEVWLELTQGAIYEHPDDEAYTTFSGFLLFPFPSPR